MTRRLATSSNGINRRIPVSIPSVHTNGCCRHGSGERKRGVDSFHPCEICTPTDISLRGKEKEERESSTRGKFSLRVGNGWKCSKRNYPELVPAVNNRANTTALLLSIFEWRLQSAGTKIFPDTGSIRAHMHGISDELNTPFRRFRVNAAVVPPLHPFRAQLSETFDFPSNGGSGLNRVFVSETLGKSRKKDDRRQFRKLCCEEGLETKCDRNKVWKFRFPSESRRSRLTKQSPKFVQSCTRIIRGVPSPVCIALRPRQFSYRLPSLT